VSVAAKPQRKRIAFPSRLNLDRNTQKDVAKISLRTLPRTEQLTPLATVNIVVKTEA
jgi:hypothetical protein